MDSHTVKQELERQDLSPPHFMTISMTSACNLECTHCWFEAGPCKQSDVAPTGPLRGLLEDFIRLGGTALRLTGGEPLLHPDWRELLVFAGGLGFEKLVLQTNGLLIGADDIAPLQAVDSRVLQIQISLDGATAQSHDRIRGAGTFQQTLNILQCLVASGFGPQIAIFFTEMKHNLAELPELLGLVADLGLASLSSGCLMGCGRAENVHQVEPPAPDQYLALLDRYRQDQRFRQNYARLGCIAPLEWCHPQTEAAGQCRFISTPYLTAAGVLYPCLMCHADAYAVSDVFDRGLMPALQEGAERWGALQRLSRDRKTAIPSCQQCPLLEECAGGCMGRAWGNFSAFLVAEDRCQQRLAIQRWKELNP